MKTRNFHILNGFFVGLESWIDHQGPYHLLPSIIWIPMEDININVRASSISFIFIKWIFQINIKKWSLIRDNKEYYIEDSLMEKILEELKNKYGWGVYPDAAKIRELIRKNKWLKVIFLNGGAMNHHTLSLLSDMLKDENNFKDRRYF